MHEGAFPGLGQVDRVRSGDGPDFWFAPRFLRSRLPSWLASVLGPLSIFGGLTLLDWVVLGSPSAAEAVYFLHLVFFLGAAIYLAKKTERILAYGESLGSDSTARSKRTLYSVRWTLVTYAVIVAWFLATELTRPGFAPTDVLRFGILPGSFHILVGASAVWAFVYSMKALHDLGKNPLALKPFTEDRTLGLKPFGSGALRLVAVYEIAVLAAAAPSVYKWDLAWTGLPAFVGLALLGFVLFFLPLDTFRRKLLEAKARELSWIRPRYAELVKAVRDSSGTHVDEEVARSLSALDTVQRGVEQIRTWPFDVVIATRLVSITVLPLLIAVLARAVMIVALHV